MNGTSVFRAACATRANCSASAKSWDATPKISGQGEEKTYTTGQMFYEQPGATHEVSKNASQTQPAKLLAMIFAKKGSVLTTQGPAG